MISALVLFSQSLPAGNMRSNLSPQLLVYFSLQTFSHSFSSLCPSLSLSLCCVFLPHSLPQRVARVIGQGGWKVGQWDGSCQAVFALFGGSWRLHSCSIEKQQDTITRVPPSLARTHTHTHHVQSYVSVFIIICM